MGFRIVGICAAFAVFVTITLAQNDTDAVVTEATPIISTCREEFKNQTPTHTMCLEDSEKVLNFGVSEEDKRVIVEYHNKIRREVEPPAIDLSALVWDDNLAEVAQKLAMQCRMYHDKNRKIPGYGKSFGQNLAAGQPTWTRAMGAWFREAQFFKYGENPKEYLGPGGWKKIGHYTHMITNRLYRVGCGFANCRDVRYNRFYVCNYVRGQTNFRRPYNNGTDRCSSCPDSCNNGLCDCGGKFCMNGGTLNINTCTCKCQRHYKEEDCSRLECPEKDRRSCGTSWPESYCKRYSNVPYDCPYMCGSCPVTSAAGSEVSS
ncbi:hypothetical protein RRG08_017321 [Elysia crispata]|uniref:SCP domain-containing protein n=1 Tax=Elysia crispata TaxID=231223 RepID=A0AAE1E615_9GAST|nr:hypothetical protein RRG08_017321 [Elysia crispata]